MSKTSTCEPLLDSAEAAQLLRIHPKTLQRMARKGEVPALKRAGITKHVTYHTFRHTFGTLLNANGENAKVVQEWLRYAPRKVTTDVYMQA